MYLNRFEYNVLICLLAWIERTQNTVWESDVLHNSSMKLIIQHNTDKKLNKIHHIPVDFLSSFTIFF